MAKDSTEFTPSIKAFCTMPVSRKKISGLSDKIVKYYGDYKDILKLNEDNLAKYLKANGQTGVSLQKASGELIPLT
ncbi:hypothetical protein [Clostridium thailandense]|uniref:hypothetical protein n=1 Tax=Clostridium thailandense TaxID=2794346 RepID=UPI00398A3C86